MVYGTCLDNIAGRPLKVDNKPFSLTNLKIPETIFSWAHVLSPTIFILVSSIGHSTKDAIAPAITLANNMLMNLLVVKFAKTILNVS
jgi:hypothetical protein